ncbi:MAG: hypothetical protein ACJ77F_11810 [Chloroflexota bacterium]
MTDPDETQPHATTPVTPVTPPTPPSGGAAPGDDMAATAPAEPGPTAPPLRADPDRPADPGWREPPWIPSRSRSRDRADGRPSLAAVVVGVGLILIGGYWFLDRTLGIAMPRIAWGSLWPVLLILLGVVVIVRSLDRRT